LENGLITGYSHLGKIGALLGIKMVPLPNASKDLSILEKLAFKIAVNVVGYSPEFLNRDDVPQSYIDKKKKRIC